jgi:hypothetical protein
MLAWVSIHAAIAPARSFHFFSVVIAVFASCLTFLAFRAALTSDGDEDAMIAAFRRGVFGAFASLILLIVFLFMFGDATRSFLAHALSAPTSSFTDVRLLVASVILGFAAGFVLPKSAAHNRKLH